MSRRILPFIALLFFAILPCHAEKNLRRPPGTTRYAAMVAQLKSLQARSAGRMTLSSIGTSVKGRTLWMATLTGNASLLKIFYLCRLHGHEPASTEGALSFLTELVDAPSGSALAETLSHVTVYVVPMANPDGSEAFLRYNAHVKDLNRDWRTRTQPETQALYRTLLRLHPDMITDQHELYPDDTRPDFTEAVSAGSGAPDAVSAACDDDQAVAGAWAASQGTPIVNHWVDDHHPARLTHRFCGVVLGIPTLLFETNRLDGTGRGVASRAHAHEEFMTAVLRLGAGEREQMLVEAAARGTLMASRHKPLLRPAAPLQTLTPTDHAPVVVTPSDPEAAP